jgi:hypothetical protein
VGKCDNFRKGRYGTGFEMRRPIPYSVADSLHWNLEVIACALCKFVCLLYSGRKSVANTNLHAVTF